MNKEIREKKVAYLRNVVSALKKIQSGPFREDEKREARAAVNRLLYLISICEANNHLYK